MAAPGAARGSHCPWPRDTMAWQHLTEAQRAMSCRKCCFPPSVAMAMGKQAPFRALFLAAVSEGSGQCVGA